jgi:hypothetical protein
MNNTTASHQSKQPPLPLKRRFHRNLLRKNKANHPRFGERCLAITPVSSTKHSNQYQSERPSPRLSTNLLELGQTSAFIRALALSSIEAN